jgi:pimeloyl-ACP methyl ester carboxylesterase
MSTDRRANANLDIPIEIDDKPYKVSATLVWTPGEEQAPVGLFVTIPGGTYDRSYWDLQVPGYGTYSFADYAIERRWMVLLLDNFGTGASSRPDDGTKLTVEMMADAVAQAATTLLARLKEGSVEDVPALPHLQMIAAGHSLGGQILATAQAKHCSFSRVALLGSSFLGNAELGTEEASREAAAASLLAMSGNTWETGFLHVPRTLLRQQFHAPDVPDSVLRAEEPGQTVLPREAGIAAIVPSLLGPVAGNVRVPVFLAYADRDMSPDPRAEAANFTGSRDVTLFLLPGSAHCHNAAATRTVLWNRLLAWANNGRDDARGCDEIREAGPIP